MNRKQREKKRDQRSAHQRQTRMVTSGVRPRRILVRSSYSEVKQGHIVPATYQRGFVDGDERVALHVVGKDICVKRRVNEVGTRSKYYRRTRPDGTEIDDIEAALSELEGEAGPALEAVTSGAPITADRKGVLAQFIAVQMIRGPKFFDGVMPSSLALLGEAITPETARADVLSERFGGDLGAYREAACDAVHQTRFQKMLQLGPKLATPLASMRWQLIRFAEPLLAYSDQPVMVWPSGRLAIDERPTAPSLGPLSALEIKFPLGANLLLLMTWEDVPDATAPIEADRVDRWIAGDANSLVIPQADRQWMHHPSVRPPISTRLITPLSVDINHAYDRNTVASSGRRRRALKSTAPLIGSPQFAHTVQVITGERSPA